MPPDRPVPQTVCGPGPFGPVPPDDLPHDRVHTAQSVDPTLALRVDALLDLPGSAWQPLARILLAAVHATGHRVWLTGGTARDLIAGEHLREVRDLDLTGTVPPGRFMDITYQAMRASRMAELRMSVTPDSLVCAVTPERSRQRLFEYRGLTGSGFHFPTVGSRLTEDARHRDFSFNSLMYDALGHVIIDPSGCGLDDLRSPACRFRPLNAAPSPSAATRIIVRAMKFALRWEDTRKLDLEPFRAWVLGLPRDLGQGLTNDDWRRLNRIRRRDVNATDARPAGIRGCSPVARS